MNDASFRRVLRSALMLALASCGGRVDGVTNSEGSSGAPVPTTTTTSTSTGTSSGDLPPPPPPPPPKKDAGTFDAGVDAGCVDDAKLPPDDICTSYVNAPCSLATDAGIVDHDTCVAICPTEDAGPKQTPYFCSVQGDSFSRWVACNYCVIGRRPDGLGECEPAEGNALGMLFAEASRLEAASVDAFLRFEQDLREHGAPHELRVRALRAARDEVRHAKTTATLAKKFGASKGEWSKRPTLEPRRRRSLVEVALENAVEGCVRETFGALVGMWQAERAQDASVRRAMKAIARDESRHARLAWSVLGWVEGELDDEGLARLDKAIEDAVAKLASDVAAEPSTELRERAGLPSAREAAALVEAFQRTMPSLRNPSSTSG